IDVTKAKRLVMAAAAIVVTVASLALPLFPKFWPVAITQGLWRQRLFVRAISRVRPARGDIACECRERARHSRITIDHDLARGLHDAETGDGRARPSGFTVLLTCRPLLRFFR
ncbi:MAG TPA: hypothetical protein VFB20_12550, partial [Burkholderiales bacterium]|nr:hypothetical protein [Burkholderiales bacterium]